MEPDLFYLIVKTFVSNGQNFAIETWQHLCKVPSRQESSVIAYINSYEVLNLVVFVSLEIIL